MTKTTATISGVQSFCGLRQEIRNVRDFVGQLVRGCPVADDVVLLSSELATNAVRHSESGNNGMFTVLVLVDSGLARVEVHDLGSAAAPIVRQSRHPSESGAGLGLVDAIASRWGFYGGQGGRVVWFEMDVDRT